MLPLPPALAGRFQVGARLGQGAIAEVVRATDLRNGADVALKILYPSLRESTAVVARFRKEVELVKAIRHPHVLAIHEVVESDGYLFLVMDHHGGGDLADRLAHDGPLGAEAIRDLAAQLGGALAAAHRAGIVHRDVKPSNVLAGSGAGRPLDVRLCDFGLARSAEGSGLTTNAAVLGTPEYMAPEVIAEGHADPRSDIYSLGVVLFEAATGRLPFVADSPYQLMRLHLQEAPPDPRTLAPQLPAALANAILKALEKDPLDRFASANALVEAFADATKSPTGLQAAAVSLAKPRGRERICAVCRGWFVQAAGVCADCRHEGLLVEPDPRGVSVLVTGPGGVGDKLSADKHVTLFRVLREVPNQAEVLGKPGRRTAPRFPFYVARAISRDSAERLRARLEAVGFTVSVETGGTFKPADMRRKFSVLGWRGVAASGVAGYGSQLFSLVPDSFPSWVGSVYHAALIAVPAAIVFRMVRHWTQPLMHIKAPAASTTTASTKATERRSIGALASRLRALTSRHDRRLVARVVERFEQLHVAGEAAIAGAATRGDHIVAALVALDEAERATAETPLSASEAQSALRASERGRVLLRGELLRLSIHLEALAQAHVRSESAGAAEEAAAAADTTAALATALDAHRDLDQFLSRFLSRSPSEQEPAALAEVKS
ncbi:MAG TPA: serine/threonine-protein kinase [Polyangia bacterium]